MNILKKINKFFIIITSMLVVFPMLVHAQGYSRFKCSLVAEEIIKLEKPIFGGTLKWKRSVLQAEEALGQDRLVKIFKDEDGMIIVGEHKTFEKYATFLQIIQTDYNGKILDTKLRNLNTIGKIVDAVYHNGRITVLIENLKKGGNRHAEIRVYSKSGKIIQSKTYKDDRHIVIPSAMVVGKDDDLYLATQYQKKNNPKHVSTVLYKLNSDKSISWKRSYLPSTPSKVHEIVARRNGGFVIAGEVAVSGGQNRQRIGGWLMVLSSQGGMEWQRAYPRGYNSRLSFVRETANGQFFTAGTAYPSDKGKSAAWVMTNYANSNPIWQKYYRSDISYEVSGFDLSDKNFAMVLLQGKPKKYDAGSHTRILDISSLGYIISDHAYIEANGVEQSRLGYFKDLHYGRFILGSAQMPSYKGNDNILDGWIASLYPMREDDLCR